MNKEPLFDQLLHTSDMELIAADDSCRVLRMKDPSNPSGEGIMTMYEVYPGIYLIYNDFHLKSCHSGYIPRQPLLAIDHCRQGVLEMEDEQEAYCLKQGEMRIDTRVRHQGKFNFPLGSYHGITICFQIEQAQPSLDEAIPDMEFSLQELSEKFCRQGQPYVLSANPTIENLFSQLYQIPARYRQDYFKVKVIELLVFLKSIEFESSPHQQPYFYKGHIEKVRGIEKLITSDLQKKYTQQELAKRFDISLTTMKECFKQVYGKPIAAWLKEYRLNQAAELLLIYPDRKISDIAAECGYETQSKFTQAFRACFHITPSQYRQGNGRKLKSEK